MSHETIWRVGLGRSADRATVWRTWLVVCLTMFGFRLNGLIAGEEAEGTTVPAHRVTTGETVPELASFDRMMERFLEEHGVPGVALAVTYQGRIVYARGFGYADQDSREQVTTKSRFRIASLSKPITAMTVLRLVDEGALRLDDRVIDWIAIPPEVTQDPQFDPRWREITIEHLLQHRAGWDRDLSFDPMFRSVQIADALQVPSPAQAADVIRWMSGQKLDFDPGHRYAYSNFGYCLLGRVIERVTGKSYEAVVREKVLIPLRMESTCLGKTRADQRGPLEVRYYDPGEGPSVFADDLDQLVPLPYGAWCLETMDAHGGWVSSVEDLAKFALECSDNNPPCVLTASTRRKMFERPPGLAGYDEAGSPRDVYYSLGWMNRVTDQGVSFWHTGSLDGTAAIVICRHDGRNLIALLNSRVGKGTDHLSQTLDPLLHQAADEVTDWP